MKKKIFSGIAAVLLLFLGGYAIYIIETRPRFRYDLTSDGNGYCISRYDYSRDIKGTLVIPDTFRGKPVVEIGSFRDASITSVIIPASVTKIGKYAFYCCRALESVIIPENVTIIADYAFSNCTKLSRAAFPSKTRIKTIGEEAFYLCASLKSLSVNAAGGSGVFDNILYAQTIGDKAFYGCASLETVFLLDWVADIGAGAFDCCTSLTGINVDTTNPNYVSIDGLLYEKNGLTLISIPQGKREVIIQYGTRYIGKGAFGHCILPTNITVPESVKEIGGDVFAGCENLFITWYYNPILRASQFEEYLITVIIPDYMTKINNSFLIFGNRVINKIENIVIGAGVTAIDNYTFSNFPVLKNITAVSNNLNYSSRDGILYNKDQTRLIQIPRGFSGEFVIPKEVTYFYIDAFYACDLLTGINVESGNERYSVFDGAVYDKDKTVIEAVPAAKTSIAIPSSVTNIREYLFDGCKKLTAINADSDNAYYSSADGVLYNKDQTVLIRVPEGIANVTILPTVTQIRGGAVNRCELLTNITIPASVTQIDSDAIFGCFALAAVNVDADNENYSSIDGVLYDKAQTRLIIVPAEFEGTVIVPDSVYMIDNNAFYYCAKLYGVIFTDNSTITRMSGTIYFYCTSLEKVVIPQSVTQIWGDIAYGCPSLTIYVRGYTSEPDGWMDGWNNSKCPVVWDYKD